MKKRIYIIISLILLFSSVINATTYEVEIQKLKPMDLNKVINSIYLEFELLYDKENVNKGVLNKYRVPVYGNPIDASGIGEFQIVNGVKQYEYLGYSPNGEKITNSLYPPDTKMDDKYLDNFTQFNWIENPLDQQNSKHWINICNTFGTKLNKLDDSNNLHLREKYLENFLIGIELTHHKHLLNHYKPDLTKEFEVSDAPINWAKYYHIIVPPTEHTFGVARLFRNDEVLGLHYMDSLLVPDQMLPVRGIPVETRMEGIGTIIDSMERGNEEFKAEEGIPTGENLYIQVTTPKYKINLNTSYFKDNYIYEYEVTVTRTNEMVKKLKKQK